MANATPRVHVVSPTAEPQIPVADLENRPASTPDESSDADSAIGLALPLSRKEKRKQKKQRHDSALPTPSTSDTESTTPSRKPPNNPPKQKRNNPSNALTSVSRSLDHPMTSKTAIQKAYPLLICSIGNPGTQYANTLHSAGHIVTSYIATAKHYKPFQKGLSGQFSKPDTSHISFRGIFAGYARVDGAPPDVEEDWTFWQSTSLMNISGKGVNRAYAEWLRGVRQQYGDSSMEGRLVVVHDELESSLGKVTIRNGASSAKGHNGLKSCQASLGQTKWWRVGVGIGRPESRAPDDVARYVMRKMTENERSGLEGSAVNVMRAFEDIAAGTR